MEQPSTPLNSATLWLQSLWLGFGLFFFYAQFSSMSLRPTFENGAWLIGTLIFLLAIYSLLKGIRQPNRGALWILSAGPLTLALGLGLFFPLSHSALFWMLVPLGIIACMTLFTGALEKEKSATLTKLCNGLLMVSLGVVASLLASGLIPPLWSPWVCAGVMLFLFLSSSLLMLSNPAYSQPAMEPGAPCKVGVSIYFGPLLFSFWLSVSFRNLLSETWIYGFHNSLLNHLLLTTAFALGAGFAFKGLQRFGIYRYLCQTSLTALLLSFALALPQTTWSWIALGLFIAYLSGCMTTGLIHLHIRPSGAAFTLKRNLAFFSCLALGFIVGNGLYFYFLQPGGIWILSLVLFAALLVLQQYLHLDPITSAGSALDSKDHNNWVLPPVGVFGEGRHTFLSRILRRCARIVAEIFFGRIRIEGAEHMATYKHVILAANHPNTFLDPLILTALSPARLHYWAKATLWRFPMIGSILDRMGAIPVFRRQDSHPELPQSDNQLSIALAARKMNKGAWFLIFPEGGSNIGLSLKPLKTGTARVAFRALEENQWSEEIAIVPVGIDYLEPSLFRTDVTLRFGKPILVNSYQDCFHQNQRSAVVQVTEEVSNTLKNLLPHLDEPDLESLVNQICSLYGERISAVIGEDDLTAARKAISTAVNHYQQMDPDTVLLFSERLNTYHSETARLSTPANHDPIPFKELFRILTGMVSFVTYGIVSNWIPYRLVQKVLSTLDPSPVWLGTAKLAWGVFIFGTYYLVSGFVAYRIFGGLVAFLLVASFVISAFIALGSLDRFAFRVRQVQLVWQAFWTQDTNDDLEEMKMSLIQDLERFREAYAFYHGPSSGQNSQE